MAPEGQRLYIADLSNIEARMLAWLAKEHELVQVLPQAVMYRICFTDTWSHYYKDDKLERYVGKTAILVWGTEWGPISLANT